MKKPHNYNENTQRLARRAARPAREGSLDLDEITRLVNKAKGIHPGAADVKEPLVEKQPRRDY
jgi:hypothetical protein